MQLTSLTEVGDAPLFLGSIAFLASFVSLLALCVCTRFRKRLKNDGEIGLGERLSNHQVACQVASDDTILPVYGPAGDATDGSAARRRDGGGGGGSSRGFLGISSSSRRKSRNSTIDRALPEIPAGFAGNAVGPAAGAAAEAGRPNGGGGGGDGVGLEVVEADPNYDLILGSGKADSERSSSAVPNTLPPSRDPIYSSVRGEDSSISEGMYAKVQEPRANGAPPTAVAGSARPGAMAMEVNGRSAGQPPFAIREHEYSRIRSVDEENMYFKVGSDSGSESGYAHVHAREASLKRANAKAGGGGDDGRVATLSTLARDHGVLVTGDEMYAEIRKTSNPNSGDTDVAGEGAFGAFDPTTMENLYAFPPPVPEKQFDLNDSYDPELLQTVQSIPYIDEAGFTSPTSPDLPPRNSVGGFSLVAGGSTTPPPAAGALSIFSQASSLSSINIANNINNSGSHNKTPSLASATSSSSTIVNAGTTVGSSSLGAPSIRGDDNGAHSQHPHPHHPYAADGLSMNPSAQAAGPDDKKDYVIITARESVPVLQARRAQEAAAKELAEKKRRHVYQNVNGGAGAPSPMDDSSDSENYAKVIDPVSIPSQPATGTPQRHSIPAMTLSTAKSSSSSPSTTATNGWVRREHTYSTVDGEEQLYSEVPDPLGSGENDRRTLMTREPIDPPPPPEAFQALLNKSTTQQRDEHLRQQQQLLHHHHNHPNNPGDGSLTFAGATSSSTSPPHHVTSVLVAPDDSKSPRSKFDQAMTELNAEPPYTTIVEPKSSKPTDPRSSVETTATTATAPREEEKLDDHLPEEPPYTQISIQSTTHSAAAANETSPPPPASSRHQRQLRGPTSPPLRVAQPLPQRPTNREESPDFSRSAEESPYTTITNCTSGASAARIDSSCFSSSSPRGEEVAVVATMREDDGRSIVTFVSDSIDGEDDGVVIRTTSSVTNSGGDAPYSALSNGVSAIASGHVTTIEISGAKHTIHGDL